MSDPDYITAHKHSIRHRKEILESEICGCFCCCKIFKPSDITEWVDEIEGQGQAALCPKCGIDSVIGSKSGYPITEKFLEEMEAHWF